MSIQEERLIDWGYLRPGRPFADALSSYQAAYGLKADAVLGTKTKTEMDGRFCNCSDHPDDELRAGANRYEANWPLTCRGDIDVSWNFQFPGASSSETDEAWDVLQDYEELFDIGLPRFADSYPDTRIRASLRRLPGSTLAWSNLANGRCSNRVQQAYDSTVSWASKKLRDSAILHEVGHALGMRHTPGDRDSIMYPSLVGPAKLNSTDIAQMVNLGYKLRDTIPPPPPPPLPDDVLIHADVWVDGKLHKLVEEVDDG